MLTSQLNASILKKQNKNKLTAFLSRLIASSGVLTYLILLTPLTTDVSRARHFSSVAQPSRNTRNIQMIKPIQARIQDFGKGGGGCG